MNKSGFIRDTVLENYLGISTRTPCTQQRPQVRCNPASPRGRAGREGRQGPQSGLPPSRGRAQGTGGTGGTEGSWGRAGPTGPGAALRVAYRPGPCTPYAPASSRLNPAPRRALLAANAAPTAPGPPRGRLRLPRPLPGPASAAGLAAPEGPSGPRPCPAPASPPRSLAAPYAACRPPEGPALRVRTSRRHGRHMAAHTRTARIWCFRSHGAAPGAPRYRASLAVKHAKLEFQGRSPPCPLAPSLGAAALGPGVPALPVLCVTEIPREFASLPRPTLSPGSDSPSALLSPDVAWSLQLVAVGSLVNTCRSSSAILVN